VECLNNNTRNRPNNGSLVNTTYLRRIPKFYLLICSTVTCLVKCGMRMIVTTEYKLDKICEMHATVAFRLWEIIIKICNKHVTRILSMKSFSARPTHWWHLTKKWSADYIRPTKWNTAKAKNNNFYQKRYRFPERDSADVCNAVLRVNNSWTNMCTHKKKWERYL
jgi:hypothetical protein